MILCAVKVTNKWLLDDHRFRRKLRWHHTASFALLTRKGLRAWVNSCKAFRCSKIRDFYHSTIGVHQNIIALWKKNSIEYAKSDLSKPEAYSVGP